MDKLIYNISVMTEGGTYEFIVASNAPQEEFTDELLAAFEGGIIQFETVANETVILNRECVQGLIIKAAEASDEE